MKLTMPVSPRTVTLVQVLSLLSGGMWLSGCLAQERADAGRRIYVTEPLPTDWMEHLRHVVPSSDYVSRSGDSVSIAYVRADPRHANRIVWVDVVIEAAKEDAETIADVLAASANLSPRTDFSLRCANRGIELLVNDATPRTLDPYASYTPSKPFGKEDLIPLGDRVWLISLPLSTIELVTEGDGVLVGITDALSQCLPTNVARHFSPSRTILIQTHVVGIQSDLQGACVEAM